MTLLPSGASKGPSHQDPQVPPQGRFREGPAGGPQRLPSTGPGTWQEQERAAQQPTARGSGSDGACPSPRPARPTAARGGRRSVEGRQPEELRWLRPAAGTPRPGLLPLLGGSDARTGLTPDDASAARGGEDVALRATEHAGAWPDGTGALCATLAPDVRLDLGAALSAPHQRPSLHGTGVRSLGPAGGGGWASWNSATGWQPLQAGAREWPPAGVTFQNSKPGPRDGASVPGLAPAGHLEPSAPGGPPPWRSGAGSAVTDSCVASWGPGQGAAGQRSFAASQLPALWAPGVGQGGRKVRRFLSQGGAEQAWKCQNPSPAMAGKATSTLHTGTHTPPTAKMTLV